MRPSLESTGAAGGWAGGPGVCLHCSPAPSPEPRATNPHQCRGPDTLWGKKGVPETCLRCPGPRHPPGVRILPAGAKPGLGEGGLGWAARGGWAGGVRVLPGLALTPQTGAPAGGTASHRRREARLVPRGCPTQRLQGLLSRYVLPLNATKQPTFSSSRPPRPCYAKKGPR